MSGPALVQSRGLTWFFLLILAEGLISCHRSAPQGEEARVEKIFLSWKEAMVHHHPDEALSYFAHDVYDYFQALKQAPAHPSTPGVLRTAGGSPVVNLLVRTTLQEKVPMADKGSLSLTELVRRMENKHIIHARDIAGLSLGAVSMRDNRASAEIYFQGTPTALRLPFIREDGAWKIDFLAILPYAEVLMRVDRAMVGETDQEQVDRLVKKLPPL